MNRVHKTVKPHIGALFCCLFAFLSGCTNFLPTSEEVQLHLLQAVDSEKLSNSALKWPDINVKSESSQRYDTNRLLVVQQRTELMPLKGMRWALYLPDLMVEAWASSLEKAGLTQLSRVSEYSSNAPTLTLYIREFQAELEETGGLLCKVSIVVELASSDGQAPNHVRSFSHQLAITQSESSTVANALDRAHQVVMGDALEWLAQLD